ncbi:hypothetical protein HOLleu_23343 [Holothuria leucospilota]|uniref:Uncharacterized protein n=1 Tax=Holothuria leucospilota TaxID=206669 RepID=A0A9Q1BV21_HOLLE|nr:hypothetical protein HOLleu_23343 [Holothuria leucospilota]
MHSGKFHGNACKMAASLCWPTNLVLSYEDVKNIATLNKTEGKLHLAKCLQWKSKIIEDDRFLRNTIQLEYLYDVIQFCATKGFPWSQISSVCLLAKEFLERCIGVTQTEAVNIFRDLVVQNSENIKESILKSFTTYIFSTFMHHFQLYQFVLTEAREEFLVKADVEIEPPGEILSLHTAKPKHIWDYEQKLQEITEGELLRQEELRKQKEALVGKEETTYAKKFEEKGENASLTREVLEQIIAEAAQSQCQRVEKLLQVKVEEKHEGLNFYLEKTSLPRPVELGPPPRTRQPPNHSAKSRLSTKTKASAKSTQSKTSKKAVK